MGCPDSTPLIAVPFYLADQRLMRIEEERAAGVETEAESMRYLRHEAGTRSTMRIGCTIVRSGGRSSALIPDRTASVIMPIRSHAIMYATSSGWYAQKHPDEDFAETFAVWLTPDLDWRTSYQGWPVLRKLEYVDALMREIGPQPPIVSSEVTPDDLPVDVMHYTVEEHYRELEEQLPIQDQRFFDGDLQTIFGVVDGGQSAGEFILQHIAGNWWVGLATGVVKARRSSAPSLIFWRIVSTSWN